MWAFATCLHEKNLDKKGLTNELRVKKKVEIVIKDYYLKLSVGRWIKIMSKEKLYTYHPED